MRALEVLLSLVDAAEAAGRRAERLRLVGVRLREALARAPEGGGWWGGGELGERLIWGRCADLDCERCLEERPGRA
jgi:hypothetical protein